MFLSSEVIRVCVQQLNLALQNRCLLFSAWRQCFFRLHRCSGQYLCSLRKFLVDAGGGNGTRRRQKMVASRCSCDRTVAEGSHTALLVKFIIVNP
jgi:hypothetical protein